MRRCSEATYSKTSLFCKGSKRKDQKGILDQITQDPRMYGWKYEATCASSVSHFLSVVQRLLSISGMSSVLVEDEHMQA